MRRTLDYGFLRNVTELLCDVVMSGSQQPMSSSAMAPSMILHLIS